MTVPTRAAGGKVEAVERKPLQLEAEAKPVNNLHGRTVLAIVLTHDAPEALRTCLTAVCAQTTPPAGVLVVDNASTPPATEVVEGLVQHAVPISVLRLPDNRGPAGGHAAGLKEFLKASHDLGWIFDDDCVPEPDCLTRLLEEEARDHHHPAAIFPTQVDRHGTVQNYPAWFGVLLSKEVVRTVGLPMEALFWWTEDTEYLQWRIPRAGFPVRRSTGARVIHFGVRRKAYKPAWKFYYETRNSVFYRLYIQRCRRLYRLGPYFIRTLLRISLQEDQRLRKLAVVGIGACHGIVGRLGKTMPVTKQESGRD